jgi:wyosine [tRNA(Phe)-imidazoG37] synthetase (radical SAM superfamily)
MERDSTHGDRSETIELKRRWNLDCELVYGPISSRRFGFSLGVNLLPSGQKVCDFDCLYCQCGWTSRSLVEQCFVGVPFPSLDEIKASVDLRFSQLSSQDHQPNTIVFSGNGEPTLHPEFPKAVELVIQARDQYLPETRVGILTNGCQLIRPSVFRAVSGMDLKSVKFDAGGEWLDRPLTDYDLDKLIPVWRELPNLVIQSFFNDGRFSNIGPATVEPWIERLAKIRPARLHLYTLDRVPPVSLMRKAGIETLKNLANTVTQRVGCAVEVFE